MRNVEKELELIADKGLTSSNLEMTGKLVDIYKDFKEADYYKEVTKAMKQGSGDMDYGRSRYNEGGYNERGYNRGGYNGDDDYGRRGGRGGYNDDEYDRRMYREGNSNSDRYSNWGPMEKYFVRLEDEVDNYNMNRTRYRNGGPQERVEEGMEMVMQAIHKFVECLCDYAETPQEKEIIRKHIEKMKNV